MMLSKEDLEIYLESIGGKPYRAKQILEWIYKLRINEIEEMSNLPADMREHIASSFHLNDLKLVETKAQLIQRANFFLDSMMDAT